MLNLFKIILVSLFLIGCKGNKPRRTSKYIVQSSGFYLTCKIRNGSAHCGKDLGDCVDLLGNKYERITCATNVLEVVEDAK